MRLKWLEIKTLLRQAIIFMVMLILAPGLFANISSGAAAANSSGARGVPSDTLTIKVGYFGGPYYTKKVYTVSDLEAMPQVQQAYTFIDNMPAVCIDSARGVRLTDLLEDCGIDVNSVQSFYFYATDIKKGWYECLPKSFLLDADRYYYPNLPEHWNSNSQSSIPGAVYGAVRVDPIMAIEDNWQRFALFPDFTQMSTKNRFRLVFGQNDTVTHTAIRSAKWVHAIEVMLGGTPPAGVSLDQDMINLKVGSTVRLTATVSPDEAVDQRVTWDSSNTSVATVDENGTVTIAGPGKAIITVSTVVGKMTDTCIVNGQEDNNSYASFGAGPPKNKAREQPQPLKKENKASGSTEISVSLKQSGKQSGVQPWRVFEMSADAVPLQQKKKNNNPDIFAAAIFSILFLFGSSGKYVEYIKGN